MPTTDVRSHTLRRLFSSDQPRLRSHMARLGPDGLKARFGYHVSDRFLDTYTECCVSTKAVAYGYFEDGMMHGIGEMHLAASDSELEGELAFSIESRWRRRGIGTQLIRHLLRAARKRHVERLMLQCSTDNLAMLCLARRFATDLTFEQGLVTGHVQVRRPSLCLRFRKGVEFGFDRALTIIDAHARPLRPSPS